MIRINLLPHREEKRKLRKQAFVALMLLGALAGAMIVAVGGGYFASYLSAQDERNQFIKAENARLDVQIKEVASLKREIEALKARQQAVEDLQADRNQPVYLLDELAQHVPEGVYLKSFSQDGQRVRLNGYAQSNERVSELLRNLGNRSPWLEKPDLIEIRSVGIGQGKEAKRVFDFIVNVDIRRPRDMAASDADTPTAATSAQRP